MCTCAVTTKAPHRLQFRASGTPDQWTLQHGWQAQIRFAAIPGPNRPIFCRSSSCSPKQSPCSQLGGHRYVRCDLSSMRTASTPNCAGRLTRRKSPSDRSAIHEAIIAGVVVLLAPEHLKAEIAKHLGDIARDTGVSVSDVEREWERFQKHLCFYEPKSQPSSVESYADVDDFPYLATSRELDTQAVYTSDRHLAAMQAPVASAFIDTHLRDYARASSAAPSRFILLCSVRCWSGVHNHPMLLR